LANLAAVAAMFVKSQNGSGVLANLATKRMMFVKLQNGSGACARCWNLAQGLG
jgi:hypothetical protein